MAGDASFVKYFSIRKDFSPFLDVLSDRWVSLMGDLVRQKERKGCGKEGGGLAEEIAEGFARDRERFVSSVDRGTEEREEIERGCSAKGGEVKSKGSGGGVQGLIF